MSGHRRSHADRLEAVLARAVEALERAAIPHALMGGLASAAIGRPRHTHDIDLFVWPEDAERALETLGEAGFRVERTDPEWLYKAFWGDAMVDVIFRSKGDITFDREMGERAVPTLIEGRRVAVLSAEDQVVIKALANSEHAPRHWHDALAILAGVELDWAYLLRRARPHLPRTLSLLLYALSEDIPIPARTLREQLECAASSLVAPERPTSASRQGEADDQLAARLREALATDPRVGELHLSVGVAGGEVSVEGTVASPARRHAVERLLAELAPGHRIESHVETLE